MECIKCQSKTVKKIGYYKTKSARVQRYKCKICNLSFSKRTHSENYRCRKQKLQRKIVEMYCEGMSQRAIARVLKINRKTVERYFIKNAHKARSENLKNLEDKRNLTTFIQIDELETFEHTKRRPLAVQTSIRSKTGEILSMKVCTIPIRALNVAQTYLKEWNSQVNRKTKLTEMLLETQKAANPENITISCDGYREYLVITKNIFGKDNVEIYESKANVQKIDLFFAKLRQDISRLRRKTLATTKRRYRLQQHLDLYIRYHNKYRLRLTSNENHS